MDLTTLLYCIMEEMSLAGVPIVFKGAMVLNLILHEKNPTGIVRATRIIPNITWSVSGWDEGVVEQEKAR